MKDETIEGLQLDWLPDPNTRDPLIELGASEDRYWAAGLDLLGKAYRSVRKRRWPGHSKTHYALVPQLRLSSSCRRLSVYGRQIRRAHVAKQEEVWGFWVDLSRISNQAVPNSDTIRLPIRMRPLIGPVDIDRYVRFLMIYRIIVESRTDALTKIAAIHLLGKNEKFRHFYELHLSRDPGFPVSRFRLRIDGLPGVGDRVLTKLRANGMDSFRAIASAECKELAQIMSRQAGYAQRLKDETSSMLLRAAVPTCGERVGPR